MRQAAAKQGDRIIAKDTHEVMVASGAGEVVRQQTHNFSGPLQQSLSTTVFIQGKPAAVVGSVGINTPRHSVLSPASRFRKTPSNQGTVLAGSRTVRVNGQPLARAGDICKTCNDPSDQPIGKIQTTGTATVFAGG
ncbi:MAG: hypothetical protein HC910_01425 [Spirulinaceae cyanobacterium SM2_1_0]|nr:hypothetical protein [Spirulinaceae cyanobacterium SM2_1_0]